ncbi:MAG: hypothetical protein FWD60_12590 [Candidatus Azobacteroides sp.]|nr:hypothetical protein [Candidatus Azobacteroides sp.]
MKIITYIFFVIVSIFTLSVSAQNVDTLKLITKENKSIEPVGFNAKTYKQFKQDKSYDYYHIKSEGLSIWDKIAEWLTKNINPDITSKQVKITLWIITGIVLLILLTILYVYRPSLFYVNKKKKINFDVEEDDIHSLDFNQLIKESLDSNRYSDAVRWTYLFTLKMLHERNYVSWEPTKTVNEYVYEMKRQDLKPEFKELSRQFLYYRYGNFEVSQETFEHFSSLSNEINKRL